MQGWELVLTGALPLVVVGCDVDGPPQERPLFVSMSSMGFASGRAQSGPSWLCGCCPCPVNTLLPGVDSAPACAQVHLRCHVVARPLGPLPEGHCLSPSFTPPALTSYTTPPYPCPIHRGSDTWYQR